MLRSVEDFDGRVRAAALDFVERESRRGGGVIDWATLQAGFSVEGVRIPLVAMQGIFKPRALELPLTLRTTAPRPEQPPPYEDDWTGEELRYAFRKDDARGRGENALLRRALDGQVPLIYLLGVEEGRYLPVAPVYVTDHDPGERMVTLSGAPAGLAVLTGEPEPRRYQVREVRTRLHQARFRHRVLTAYSSSCTLCRLRRPELVDASHIVPDAEEAGVPVVANGLALCRIHHAAYDADLVGIRPDLGVEVNREVLDEVDGPMLRVGLQDLHGQRLAVLPRRPAERPDPARLEVRYARFRSVA
jgi:putative restriction endonuclease